MKKTVIIQLGIIITLSVCAKNISHEKMLVISKELGALTDEAVAHLEKGKELAYKNKEAVAEYNKSIDIFLRAAGRCSQVKSLHNVLEFQCIQQAGMLAMCYYYRGLSKNEQKDYDGAITDFSKTIEMYPDHQSSYINRGIAYKGKQQYDKAMNDLKKAVELLPDDPDSRFNIALVFSIQNKEKEALENISKAVEIILKEDRGSVKDVNDYRKTWYDQIRKEPDLKNINKTGEFRELLKKLTARYK